MNAKPRYDPTKCHRRSIRLKDYDYTQEGAYFVTICAHNRACTFGEVLGDEVVLTDFGTIAQEEWLRTAEKRPNVELDAFVVMPNHVHGIVVIVGADLQMGTARRAPTGTRSFGESVPGSLSSIVGAFKSSVARRANRMRGTPGAPVWQTNYYEHVIRNEDELNRIRQYIADNPARWALDFENPLCSSDAPPDIW